MYFFQLFIKLAKKVNLSALKVIYWAMLLNVFFGVCFYFAERDAYAAANDGAVLTIWDSIWWAMVTMTTVGYGDYYAKTFIGRFLISYPCMVLGIGIIGYLVGLVANSMIEWAAKKRKGKMQIPLKDHILICNYPSERKVNDIITELRATEQYAKTRFVLVADNLEELPDVLVKARVRFVKGSPCDEDVLFQANILKCNGALVLAENPDDPRSDDRTYTICSLLELIEREHNHAIKTIAELTSAKCIKNFVRANVNGFITAESLASGLVVQEYINPGVNGVIGQLISNAIGSQIYLYETRLQGHRIVELQKGVLDHEANIQIIGIIQGQSSYLNPPKNLTINPGDRLIVLAEKWPDLSRIEREILEK